MIQNTNCSIQDLVGKEVIAKVKDKRRPIVGESAEGRIKVDYICDQGRNAIGRRQEKQIRLKEGSDVYIIQKDDIGRITSFYGVYPTVSPWLIGIGIF